jgi:diamine N-acetyltransferase
MTIRLVEITEANFRDAIKLKVAPGQESFVAENVYSIAESRFHPDWLNFGFYDDETMVGYSMCGFDPIDGQWWIIRFMVGAQFQKKGYGKQAMQALLDLFSAKSDCKEIMLGVEQENSVARQFYVQCGFSATGEVNNHEEGMRYPVVR